MTHQIREVVHNGKEDSDVTLHVGKFTFTTDGDTVHVHNNANHMPIWIRSTSYADSDAAYKSAWKQANLQARA